MYKKVILMLLFVGTDFVFSTDVDECKNIAKPIVDIEGCDEQPCTLIKGKPASMIVKFKSTDYVDALEMKVSVSLAGIPLPYPLDKEVGDVCRNLLNTHCPLEQNEPGVYKLEMPVLKEYPSISLKLSFTIQSVEKKPKKMSCFAVACTVVDA